MSKDNNKILFKEKFCSVPHVRFVRVVPWPNTHLNGESIDRFWSKKVHWILQDSLGTTRTKRTCGTHHQNLWISKWSNCFTLWNSLTKAITVLVSVSASLPQIAITEFIITFQSKIMSRRNFNFPVSKNCHHYLNHPDRQTSFIHWGFK
jgi:hypothetical protein